MKWMTGVTEALQKGKCFSQGNYMVASYDSNGKGYSSAVYYYGHKVFQYSHHPEVHEDTYTYDFCGYTRHSRTTKLICCCLEAVGAKYRVKTVKGEIVEVPVTEKTHRYISK